MRIRGQRECQDCGTRWAYYETGSVECPSCGSLRSVGVEEVRTLHTATPATLDLTDVRNALEAGESPRHVADEAAAACREFVRGYGFVDAGELRPLDETFLAASELRHVATRVGRAMTLDDDEEFYFLSLLRGADHGNRPPTDEVPESFRDARGLAYAGAVEEYRSDLRSYLEERPDPAVGEVLQSLGEYVRRVRALDGDVPVEESELLVRVATDVGRYLRADDETALVEARDRLDRLP